MKLRLSGVDHTDDPIRAYTSAVASGAVAGDAVTKTAEGTVGRGADTEPLVGRLELVETDGLGTVATRGRFWYRRAGAALADVADIVVDGAGAVKAGTGGLNCRVVAQGTIDSVVYVLLEH